MPASLPSQFIPLVPIEFEEGMTIRLTQFGQGYVQRSPEPINAETERMTLEFFVANNTDASTLATFFKARATDPLAFTPPGESAARLYLAQMPFKKTFINSGAGGKWRFSCSFDRIYGGQLAPPPPTGTNGLLFNDPMNSGLVTLIIQDNQDAFN